MMITNQVADQDQFIPFTLDSRKPSKELTKLSSRSSNKCLLHLQIKGLCDITKDPSSLLDQLQTWDVFQVEEFKKPEVQAKPIEEKKVVLRPRTQNSINFLSNIEEIIEMIKRRVKAKVIGRRFNIDPTRLSGLVQTYLRKRSQTISRSFEKQNIQTQLTYQRVHVVAEICKQFHGKMFTVKKVSDQIDDQVKQDLDLKLNTIRLIMKDRLGYGWKTCNVRPSRSNHPSVKKNRSLFKAFMSAALKHDAHFTYVDEMSVCSRHLSYRSWIHKKNPIQIIAPPSSESISVIGAITESDSLDCMLRKGTNKEEQVLEFLLDLDEKLERKKGSDYLDFRKTNILILDNAAYHKTGLIKRFATKRGIQMITMP